MLTIRRATPEDAAKIAHVHVDSWRTTYAGIVPDEYLAALNEGERETQWQHWLTSDTPIYVSELDNQVVGFIGGGPIREPIEDYDAELYAIYILQQAQGQGIGKALLRQLAAMLQTQGFSSMVVCVLDQNPARHFYMRTGAQFLASKEIEIGGATLAEAAYGWPDLKLLERRL
jgi:ribosomal protein S18 acetylase RimI-like enzyme